MKIALILENSRFEKFGITYLSSNIPDHWKVVRDWVDGNGDGYHFSEGESLNFMAKAEKGEKVIGHYSDGKGWSNTYRIHWAPDDYEGDL